MNTEPLVQGKVPGPTAHQPGSALAAMSPGPRYNIEFGLLAPSNPGLPVSAYMSGGKGHSTGSWDLQTMLNLQMVYTLVNYTEPSGVTHPDHRSEKNSLMQGPCDLSDKQLQSL